MSEVPRNGPGEEVNAPLDLDAIKRMRGEQDMEHYLWRQRVLAEQVPALVAEVERLRELADFARLLGPARMILDRCAVALEGMEEGQEAEQMAQRIVGLIGHPVTDEPPHALVELERLRAEKERWEREAERLKRLVDESVSRSALVQVGMIGPGRSAIVHSPEDHGDRSGLGPYCLGRECQPVYVIREDTDA